MKTDDYKSDLQSISNLNLVIPDSEADTELYVTAVRHPKRLPANIQSKLMMIIVSQQQ